MIQMVFRLWAITLRVTEILDFFPEDFLVAAPTLIDYVDRYIELIDYDWSVNASSVKGGG